MSGRIAREAASKEKEKEAATEASEREKWLKMRERNGIVRRKNWSRTLIL